ncbi:DUF5018 domain-containing protein [Chitinophaga arvensicola]|uniref:DUF5018 domain-containing protein n=1 Tax=Chitinophaga arvensicola TaxID=29529 RepID=A0A1I0SB57_9BACT|nr:DUF5018 domain-containing protein [Chitinophaga arvensicola]SEW53876.1 protein of unknown function [Chitinophaga arvensicola]
MIIGLGMAFNACQKPEPIFPKEDNSLQDIWVAIPGVKDASFMPVYNTTKDSAYIEVPYFYPVESDNETDITKLILRANLPLDAVMTPAIGTQMDLSKPVKLEIKGGTGAKRNIVVVTKKVGDLSVKKATMTYSLDGVDTEVEGIVKDNDVIFYAIPGTDVSKVKVAVTVNAHSTTTLVAGATVDLSAAVPFTVKSIDGAVKTYQLKVQPPVKKPYGIGITRKLFVKLGAAGGISTDYTETSMAVSGDYLVIVSNTNPSKLRLFNRTNGTFVRDMPLPAPGYYSFQMQNDSTGALLGATFAASGDKFQLYRWKSATDPAPEKILEWTNNVAWGGLGRRVRIYGDLQKDAVVYATGSLTNEVFKWRIKDGKVINAANTPDVNAAPVISTYKSGSGSWGYLADAVPTSTSLSGTYFLNYGSEIALVNGGTNITTATFNTDAAGYIFHAPSLYFNFNGASYFAFLKYTSWSLNAGNIALFDVTDPSAVSMSPNNPGYSAFNVFNSEVISGAADNGNGTGDLCVSFSPDRSSAYIYMVLTNVGIIGYELTTY